MMINVLFCASYSIMYYFIELNNVRMPNDLENINLSGDSFYVSLLYNLVFIQHLYCHLSKDQSPKYIYFSNAPKYY